MTPSPTKSPAKTKRRMSRNTAEIAREICSAIKEVYYDSSKNAFKKGASALLTLYKEERDVAVNKDEYMAELEHRLEKFLEGAKNQEGQKRVFKLISLLAAKALIELDDLSILESLTLSIHKKKYSASVTIRNSVVALIGRLLHCTVYEPEETDDPETFYASYLPQQTFADLFNILWYLSGDPDEEVRCEVLYALQKIQRYPGLMIAINAENQTSKQLILIGIKDPAEIVRCQAISSLDVKDHCEAKIIMHTIIHDTSETVRFAVAKKLTDVPVAYFSRSERNAFLKSRHLLLEDVIIPEYYDVLYSWATDSYCEIHGIDFDHNLDVSLVLTGLFFLLDSFRITKDLHLIFSRFFEYLRKKLYPNDDERSYIYFAQRFNYKGSPYLESTNFEGIAFITDNSTGVSALNIKIKKLFMWQILSEYCCHPSLSEETRVECRMLLLPTMFDFAKFVSNFWMTLNIGKKENEQINVRLLQNTCAKCLLSIFPILDREPIGMLQWRDLLENLFIDYSFYMGEDLISKMVHDYLYYHYSATVDLDRSVHALSDLVNKIGEVGKMDCTQDLFADATMQMNLTQMPMSQSDMSQHTCTTMEPMKRKRCVLVLAGGFKNGFFLRHHASLEGLVKDFAIYTFDYPIDLESKTSAFYCIAGMVPLLDQNNHNFIKGARHVLSDDILADDIKKVALNMLCDAILVYGYPRVNTWFFVDMDDRNASNPNMLDIFIELFDTPKLSSHITRMLLRLIIFDQNKTYHEAFVYLLLRLFSPNGDDKIKKMLVYFFTTYCRHSREHQCIMANAFVDAMTKLVTVDLSKPYAQANIDEMINFVLQVTSFNALHLNAFEREQGSSHLHLASRILSKMERLIGDNVFSEHFGYMLSRCEVSEIFDDAEMAALKKACDKLRRNASARKKYIENYAIRLEKAKAYAESKKAIERPEVIPKTREEFEQEFRSIIDVLKCTNEETGLDKRAWLLERLPEEEDALSKMKIFGDPRRTAVGTKVVVTSGKCGGTISF